jgi:hypothetical protein
VRMVVIRGSLWQTRVCEAGLGSTANLIKITNSVALVRERAIATEQPPLVGEVSANFCR